MSTSARIMRFGFIDAYVDGLEMEELGFKQTAPKETGRPPYDPRDLLKLYILWVFEPVKNQPHA